MQLKKLAVISNACFWLTLLFQFWENAREIYPHILGTIVTLGILAVILNVCWIAVALIPIKTKNRIGQDTGEPIKNPSGKPAAFWLFNWFNLLSFIAQLILLGIKFL